MVDPLDPSRRKAFSSSDEFTDLLAPALRGGARVCACPELAAVRDFAREQVAMLDPSITRFLNPHTYPVGLESGLNDLRTELVYRARGVEPGSAAS